jgi:D-alanyl-D-alanine dipeptidase
MKSSPFLLSKTGKVVCLLSLSLVIFCCFRPRAFQFAPISRTRNSNCIISLLIWSHHCKGRELKIQLLRGFLDLSGFLQLQGSHQEQAVNLGEPITKISPAYY